MRVEGLLFKCGGEYIKVGHVSSGLALLERKLGISSGRLGIFWEEDIGATFKDVIGPDALQTRIVVGKPISTLTLPFTLSPESYGKTTMKNVTIKTQAKCIDVFISRVGHHE